MNLFDIITIAIIAFCLIRGAFKGLIGELSGIIGVVAAFYGAYTYYPLITGYAVKWIESAAIRNLLAFFLLFCAILVVIGLLSLIIRKILKLVFLGWVDRSFGLVFGAAKGALIMAVLFIMITNFLPNNSKILKSSVSAPYIAKVAENMTVFVSKNSRKDFMKKLEELKIWKQ